MCAPVVWGHMGGLGPFCPPVLTGLQRVHGADDAVQLLEEVVPVELLGAGPHVVLVSRHLHGGVHAPHGRGGHLCFRLLQGHRAGGQLPGPRGTPGPGPPVGRAGAHRHVRRAEEELPVQVGVCHHVHVGDGDVPARPRCQPHHGKVLEQLAADGTGPHLLGQRRCSSAHRSGSPPAPRPHTLLTTKNFWRPSSSWNLAPNTAIWPS